MSQPVATTFLIMALYHIILGPSIEAVTYLYYSSPGDSLGHYSGVWGGPIDIERGGRSDDLRQSGFHCAYMYDGGFYTGFIVKGMFLDPISKRVLVQLVESFDSRVSLVEGPICSEKPECPSEFSGEVKVYMAHGEATDVVAAEPGPFAMWNSSVYFVVQRWTPFIKSIKRLHELELRHLTGCENLYPFTIHRQLDLEKCSVHVATLRKETTPGRNMETFNSAYHLHIIKKDNGELAFVTQYYNWTLDENGDKQKLGVTLVYANRNGFVEELFTTQISEDYHLMRARLVETGGIDWKDGVLCWSAVEAILCANWNGEGPLENVQTVLKPGQASSVCHDSDLYLSGDNITTGVAIADISDGFYLYFGCQGGEPVRGGAGRVRLYTNEAGTRRQVSIEPLNDRYDTIYAGSMFLTDLCDIRPISTDDKGYNSSSDSNTTKREGKWPTSNALRLLAHTKPVFVAILLTLYSMCHYTC